MESMKCPHCLVTVHTTPYRARLGEFKEGVWIVEHRKCPSCQSPIVNLAYGSERGGAPIINDSKNFQVHPRGSGRPPVPQEVTDATIADDYREACEVLVISPKASAALSRRCLQHMLRTKAGVKAGDLADEIQQVLDLNTLPTHLAGAIDAVRHVGNFAAHPIKSKASGQIVDVESGEAEWNLDTLEGLLDFYFVQPAQTAAKRAALNAKLQAAGKPPLK